MNVRDQIDEYWMAIRNNADEEFHGYMLWVTLDNGLGYPVRNSGVPILNSAEGTFGEAKKIELSDEFMELLWPTVDQIILEPNWNYMESLPDKLPVQEKWLLEDIVETHLSGDIPTPDEYRELVRRSCEKYQ